MKADIGSRRFRRRTHTLSVTSGKGGVGKSTLVANLGASLAGMGRRVLILDGDLGMANLDLMFGVRPQGTIEHVIKGEQRIEDIVVQVRPNTYLIPGGSGIYGLSRLDAYQKQILLSQVGDLDQDFDFMVIDTAPGIDDNVLYLNAAAEDVVVVVTPDPASLTDSYALIKVLSQRHRQTRFSILANMVRDDAEGLAVFRRLSEVSDRFLNVGLDWLGAIPIDPNLRQATKKQQLVVQASPTSASSQAILGVSERFLGSRGLREPKGGIQFFWEQLSGVA